MSNSAMPMASGL